MLKRNVWMKAFSNCTFLVVLSFFFPSSLTHSQVPHRLSHTLIDQAICVWLFVCLSRCTCREDVWEEVGEIILFSKLILLFYDTRFSDWLVVFSRPPPPRYCYKLFNMSAAYRLLCYHQQHQQQHQHLHMNYDDLLANHHHHHHHHHHYYC